MKNLFELKNWDVLTVDQAIDSDMKIFKGIKSFNLAGLHEDGVNSVIERLNLEVFHDFLAGIHKFTILLALFGYSRGVD